MAKIVIRIDERDLCALEHAIDYMVKCRVPGERHLAALGRIQQIIAEAAA